MDWQRRVKQAGWKVVYLPEAVITHYEGKSSDQAPGTRHLRFNRSKVRYFRKHHGRIQAEFLRLALLAMFGIEWFVEAGKYALGSQRLMRRARLTAYSQLIQSRLSELSRFFMRVLFVTGEYPVMQGGVGDYTHRLGQALGVLGAEVHVLTHVDAGGDHLRAPDGTQEPVVYPRLGKRGWNLWRQVLRMIDEVKPDVVHIQYQSAAYGLHPAVNLLPSRLHLKHKHLPVAVTFHDLKYPVPLPEGRAAALAVGAAACQRCGCGGGDEPGGLDAAARCGPAGEAACYSYREQHPV